MIHMLGMMGLAGFIDLGITFDYTLRNVVLGAAILGIVGGALGTFAVLRRQSLLSDALAHAALPGICIVFMLTGTKTPELLLLGAGISGWIGTLALLGIVRGTRLKEDAALGTVLTVSFGLGILLLTRIQHSDRANQSGLDRYLFGQAATLLERDVLMMALLGALALGLLALFYKEFKLLAFDPAFGASLGFPAGRLDVLLTSLIVLAVLIGLQTVGVVLMVAMLIAPAAAARQWTHHLGLMLLLSAIFGALAGVIGAVVSSVATRTPTGPVIVLAATGIFLLSLLAAPGRGILWEWLRHRRQRHRVALAHRLAEVHELVARQTGTATDAARLAGVPFDPHTVAEARGHGVGEVQHSMADLIRRGLVEARPGGHFVLTPPGAAEAVRAARNQHLWQAYLAHQLELPVQDVHLDVGDLERTLSPEALTQIEALAAAEARRAAAGRGVTPEDRP